jgi:tetratricopeptide (TPR) repeat protein
VLCELARQAGLGANVVYLTDIEKKTSGHTIAELRVDGRWVLFDPYQGVVFPTEDGSPGTLEDLAARPELSKRYPFYDGNLRGQFTRAMIWVPADPSAVLMRTAALEKAWRAEGAGASLFVDAHAESLGRRRALSAAGHRDHAVNVWFYPFKVRESLGGEEGRRARAAEREGMGAGAKGRSLYLAGRFAEALEALPADAEDGLYFRGVTCFAMGNAAGARSAFGDLLRRFPKTRWRIPALIHLGRTAERNRDYAAALAAYRRIETPDGNLMDRIEILEKKPELLEEHRLLPALGVGALP